jgi:hypothetical protein
MQNSKIYNQYDNKYFPTEELAKEALKELGSDGKGLVIKKLSYN